jgi:hypothetical protein
MRAARSPRARARSPRSGEPASARAASSGAQSTVVERFLTPRYIADRRGSPRASSRFDGEAPMRVRALAQPRIDRAEPSPLQHDSNRRLTRSTYGRWFKSRDLAAADHQGARSGWWLPRAIWHEPPATPRAEINRSVRQARHRSVAIQSPCPCLPVPPAGSPPKRNPRIFRETSTRRNLPATSCVLSRISRSCASAVHWSVSIQSPSPCLPVPADG